MHNKSTADLRPADPEYRHRYVVIPMRLIHSLPTPCDKHKIAVCQLMVYSAGGPVWNRYEGQDINRFDRVKNESSAARHDRPK